MNSTAYSHREVGDLWTRDRRARDRHSTLASTSGETFGASRRSYRPVLGVTGTLQETPNPCMERDRYRAELEANVEFTRRGGAVPRELRTMGAFNRAAEADLNWGVPPHQVHHHNFGWTLAGSTTVYNARRPWGIGLQYADQIAPIHKRIAEAPVAKAPASPRSRKSSSKSHWVQGGHRVVASGGKESWQNSIGQYSTAVPSDASLRDSADVW